MTEGGEEGTRVFRAWFSIPWPRRFVSCVERYEEDAGIGVRLALQELARPRCCRCIGSKGRITGQVGGGNAFGLVLSPSGLSSSAESNAPRVANPCHESTSVALPRRDLLLDSERQAHLFLSTMMLLVGWILAIFVGAAGFGSNSVTWPPFLFGL